MKSLVRILGPCTLIGCLLTGYGCGGGGGGGGPDASTVTVSGTGTSSAANGNVTYLLQTGTYTYTITGFGAGDNLDFPPDQTATVDNDDWADGVVRVQWAANGNVMIVALSGLTPAQDASLNTVENLNTVFGAGTVR